MSIVSTLERAFTALEEFGRKSFENIKKRRVHVIAAYYYIGVWQALEPLIAFFGFSDRTVHFIRNFGISFFPFVLVFTWFHGEPGRQPFSKRESIAYVPTLLVTVFLFMQLSRAPIPQYTIMAPFSQTEQAWYREHILDEFEKKHHVRLTLHSTLGENDQQLRRHLASPDTSVLLMRIPLHMTSVLLSETSDLFLSFDDIVTDFGDKWLGRYNSLVDDFDSQSIEWGRRHDGRLFYLPAEFQVEMLIYSKSNMADVFETWESLQSEVIQSFEKISDLRWPHEYVFEPEPNLWDWYDVFVFAWSSTSGGQNRQKKQRVAFPSCKDEFFFSLLNKSLQFDVPTSEFFQFPLSLSIFPPPAMIEMFTWDALFREADLFYDGMWRGSGLWSREIAEAYREGELTLAAVNNRDAATLIDMEDVGFAPFPRSPHGERTGMSTVWYWAVPRNTPDSRISFLLAEWITNDRNQSDLCGRFGAMPTRKALLENWNDIPMQHRTGKELLTSCRRQLESNVSTIVSPFKDLTFVDYEIIQAFYHGKWSKIMIERNYRSTDGTISGDKIFGELTTIP